jgi:hypothetical protein
LSKGRLSKERPPKDNSNTNYFSRNITIKFRRKEKDWDNYNASLIEESRTTINTTYNCYTTKEKEEKKLCNQHAVIGCLAP